ncbi:protein CEBPZOS [Chlamydotis macqueenii]
MAQLGEAVDSRTCCQQPEGIADGKRQRPRTATCTQRHRCAQQRPPRACPGRGRTEVSRGLPRRVSASVCLRPGHRLAPRQEPQPPKPELAPPSRLQAAARMECACAARLCGNCARSAGGRTAHVQRLRAAAEGRRAPAMARRVAKALLLLEAAGLLGALLLYRAMDRSQDFRYTMQKRFPSILEVYYKSNEWSGIHGIRENDQMTWLSSKN